MVFKILRKYTCLHLQQFELNTLLLAFKKMTNLEGIKSILINPYYLVSWINNVTWL